MRRTIVYLAVAAAVGIIITAANYDGALSVWVVVACVVGLGVIASIVTRGSQPLNPVAVVAMLALAVTGVLLVAYMLQGIGPLGAFGLAAALGLAILVLMPFDRKRLRDNRELAGQCTECGYDLRESPERCPECGASIPVDLARRRRIAALFKAETLEDIEAEFTQAHTEARGPHEAPSDTADGGSPPKPPTH